MQNFRMFLREGVELILKLAPHVEALDAVHALKSNDDVKKKKTIFSLSKQFAVGIFFPSLSLFVFILFLFFFFVYGFVCFNVFAFFFFFFPMLFTTENLFYSGCCPEIHYFVPIFLLNYSSFIFFFFFFFFKCFQERCN